MPRVTMKDAAATAVVEPASATDLPAGHFELTVGDTTIVSKPMLRVREEMALSENVGADARLNPVWVLWATLACCVTHINGEPVRMPVSKLQVEALIERIGDDAMRALLARYRQRQESGAAETRAKN